MVESPSIQASEQDKNKILDILRVEMYAMAQESIIIINNRYMQHSVNELKKSQLTVR